MFGGGHGWLLGRHSLPGAVRVIHHCKGAPQGLGRKGERWGGGLECTFVLGLVSFPITRLAFISFFISTCTKSKLELTNHFYCTVLLFSTVIQSVRLSSSVLLHL